MLNRYDQGQLVRVSVAFTNAAGQAADPDTVTLTYRTKGGAVVTKTSPDVVRDSTGNYHCDIDTTGAAGMYRYRFAGAGAVIAAAQSEFSVTPNALD